MQTVYRLAECGALLLIGSRLRSTGLFSASDAEVGCGVAPFMDAVASYIAFMATAVHL